MAEYKIHYQFSLKDPEKWFQPMTRQVPFLPNATVLNTTRFPVVHPHMKKRAGNQTLRCVEEEKTFQLLNNLTGASWKWHIDDREANITTPTITKVFEPNRTNTYECHFVSKALNVDIIIAEYTMLVRDASEVYILIWIFASVTLFMCIYAVFQAGTQSDSDIRRRLKNKLLDFVVASLFRPFSNKHLVRDIRNLAKS